MKSDTQSRSSAEEQAALWAARLEGAALEAADRVALDTWLAQSPAHRPLLAAYCQFSADLELQLPALVEAGAIAMPAARTATETRWKWSWPKIAGASIAAAAALTVGLWLARPGVKFENFASLPGQRQAFTLADGTRVELNAHSNLQFVNRGGERRAKLVEGEAFFVVSKNPARPFIVETPTGSVRVTGTTFAVRTETATLDVTVLEGSVQVAPGAATGAREPTMVALAGGDRLSATTSGVTTRRLSREALDDALAWRQGIVVFVDEPLDAALARFAHYQARSIRVTPAAAVRRVTGRHSLDDLDGFLLGIEEPLGIRTTKETSGALRVSLRSE
jgi:transmembrane sensor